MSTHRKNT